MNKYANHHYRQIPSTVGALLEPYHALINRLADSYGNGVLNLKVEPDHEGVPGGIYVKHDHDILARRTILDRKT